MGLKMRPEHLAKLRKYIEPLDTEANRQRYRDKDPTIPRAESVKDWDMRYRWDLFNAAGRAMNPHGPGTKFCCDELYPYLNDQHIDSALKSLVKPLVEQSRLSMLLDMRDSIGI